MNTWNINPIRDDTAELGQVATEITALASGLRTSVEHLDRIQFVWELFDQQPSVGRSVVQVHVSSTFFETFFNSPVGYRAMFRRGPYIGSATNGALLREVLSVLSPRLPESLNVPVIKNPGPEWVEHYRLARSEFLRSLDPCLAKLWYSTAEIRADGTIRSLPYGVIDGKIDVGLSYHWAEIRQNEQDCIIEIKGAFIGPYGLFQVKDPEERARKLFEKGEA
jgi:hypothetical protein